MEELVGVYDETKEKAKKEGRRILETYEDDDDVAEKTVMAATEFAINAEKDLHEVVKGKSSELRKQAEILGYDVRDHVRRVPFQALGEKNRKHFIKECAWYDDMVSFPVDQSLDPAYRNQRAIDLYKEMDTLVFVDDWIDYLRNDVFVWHDEKDWTRELRALDVGDR